MLAGWRGSGEAGPGGPDRRAQRTCRTSLRPTNRGSGGSDINPLIVHPTGEGCTVADALIVPREGTLHYAWLEVTEDAGSQCPDARLP